MVVKVTKKKAKSSKKDMTLSEGKGTVSKQNNKSGPEHIEQFDHIKPQVFDKPPANVIVKLGYTKNLGNFESMRCDVSLSLPCEEKDIDETFDTAKEWVDEKMSVIIDGIESETEED